MRFENQNIVVVGFGKSGQALAAWLSRQGANITISDRQAYDDLPRDQVLKMQALGVEFETGGHRGQTLAEADLIVISPGVPLDIEPLQSAREKGVPIMGELQLALHHLDIPVIAVTGTNGKSTVTSLIGHMIASSGYEVFVGGNIGTPLTDYLLGSKLADYAVIEISSFQLDVMDDFSPDIALILNISPDHLDRYKSYGDYVRSKLKLMAYQKENQFVILNDDDEILKRAKPEGKAKVLRYGLEPAKERQAFMDGECLMALFSGQKPQSFSLTKTRLPGSHNRENLMAGALAGLSLDLNGAVIQHTIDHFKGLAHRLEWVKRVKDVDYYNDSKATNIDAALRAIKSFNRPVVFIAGGRHKGANYLPLSQGARGRVKKAVFLGEARELLANSFRAICPCSLAGDLEEAVEMASSAADPGDVVLLSPACSSFDMFQDYIHRGDVFKSIVERLDHGQ